MRQQGKRRQAAVGGADEEHRRGEPALLYQPAGAILHVRGTGARGSENPASDMRFRNWRPLAAQGVRVRYTELASNCGAKHRFPQPLRSARPHLDLLGAQRHGHKRPFVGPFVCAGQWRHCSGWRAGKPGGWFWSRLGQSRQTVRIIVVASRLVAAVGVTTRHRAPAQHGRRKQQVHGTTHVARCASIDDRTPISRPAHCIRPSEPTARPHKPSQVGSRVGRARWTQRRVQVTCWIAYKTAGERLAAPSTGTAWPPPPPAESCALSSSAPHSQPSCITGWGMA